MGFVNANQLPLAYVNVPYYFTVAYLKNGKINHGVVFQLQTELPPWLRFNVETGEFYGTPYQWSQSITLTLKADNDVAYLNLIVSQQPVPELSFLTKKLPKLSQLQFYCHPFERAGGVGKVSFSVTTLPAGLALDAQSGVLYGCPQYFGGTLGFWVTMIDESHVKCQSYFNLRMEEEDE